MKDELTIGSSPLNETCAQIRQNGYYEQAQKECRAFLNQLIRIHGNPPANARLAVKGFNHEFGTYYEVVVIYDDEVEEAEEYAFLLEGNIPEEWDDEALEEMSTTPPEQTETPSDEAIQQWLYDGVAEATDGCMVEPDGVCPHGCPSWLVKLGII